MQVGLFLTALVCATATNLTPSNWDAETAGKTTFIKFQAPWWGHCKKMKPDWDRVMETFKGHKTILVADVDCTAEGKPLCDSNGVKGFPTIKWGDAANLEDYQGGRDYKAMNDFAAGLKPACSPSNIDLCDDEGKAAIEKVQALSDEEIASQIADGEKKGEDAEEFFKAELDKLQKAYQVLQDNKEATLKEVKDAGLGMLKAVQASRKKDASSAGKEEL